jgi:hypothetical protein
LSFFDDVDEPPAAPRASPRSRRTGGTAASSVGGARRGGATRAPHPPGASRPPRRPRTGGRPPDRQAIQTRRLILAVVVVVLIVVIALGVHSCDVSSTNSALRDYADSVSTIVTRSDETGTQLFRQLSAGGGASAAQSLALQVDQDHAAAASQLRQAQGLNVPGAMAQAQAKLVLALQMRRDGTAVIAGNIQQATSGGDAQAVERLATGTARFYASDVLYKAYAAPEIAAALNSAGIRAAGMLASGQFLQSISWLDPSYIAARLNVTLPSAKSAKIAPGTHGHQLNSVSVGGTLLTPGATNTLPASPPPTFTLNLTNSGQNNETDVTCKVTVSGGGPSGQTVIPETTPGETTTCQVKLPSSPPPGNYTVTAEVEPVPGEKNTANNVLTFPVTFQ